MENMCISINKELKEQIEDICNQMGLNIATLITIYFKAIIRQNKIPFEIKL